MEKFKVVVLISLLVLLGYIIYSRVNLSGVDGKPHGNAQKVESKNLRYDYTLFEWADKQGNFVLPAFDTPEAPKLRDDLTLHLSEKRFAALDSLLDEYVDKYLNGKVSLDTLLYLFRSFHVSNPDFESRLNQWKEETNSWNSQVASIFYSYTMAWQWRGESWWSEVDELNRKNWKKFLKTAEQGCDLVDHKADTIPVTAETCLRVKIHLDKGEPLSLVAEGVKRFPNVPAVYHLSMNYLKPRWGGSDFQRAAFVSYVNSISQGENAIEGLGGFEDYYKVLDKLDANEVVSSPQSMLRPLQAQPYSVIYRKAVVRMYEKMQIPKLALKASQILSNYHRNSNEVRLTRARLLNKMQRYAEAQTELERLFKYSTHDRDANLLALDVYASQNKVDEVRGVLDRVLYFTESDPYTLAKIANVFQGKLGKVEEAKSFYHAALQQRPLDPWATYRLGLIYSEQGESCTASKMLEQFFMGCELEIGNHKHFCKDRYFDQAMQTLNSLNAENACSASNQNL